MFLTDYLATTKHFRQIFANGEHVLMFLVQAGVALTTAATYNGPEYCCLLLYFVRQYPCKCKNLGSNFPSQSSQDNST